MAVMQQIDVIIKRHKWGWIGHTLRKDESPVTRHDKLCNGIVWMVLGEKGETLRDVQTNCGKGVQELSESRVR